MQRLTFICLFAVLGLLACGKHQAAPGPKLLPGDTSIYGQWQLSYSYVFSPLNPHSNSASNAVVTLKLNVDSSYVCTLNGQPMAQGAYHLTRDTISPIRIDTAYVLDGFVSTGAFNAQFGFLRVGMDSLYLQCGLVSPEGPLIFVFSR